MSKLPDNFNYLTDYFIGNIPDSWKIVKLEDIADVQRGKFTFRPRTDPRFYGGKIPFIQTGDVSNSGGRITKYSQTLNEEGLKISKMFPKGTICVTIAANIGDASILDFDSAFPDSIIGINPVKTLINSIYLLYYLIRIKPKLNEMSVQSTQKNINLGYLKPLPVPLPPLSEQQAIVTILENVDALITTTQQLIDRLQTLKRGLMQQLFTQGIGHTEFQETKLGRIPKGWKIKKLMELIDINPRYNIPEKDSYAFLPMDAINEDNMAPNYWERRNKNELTNIKFKNGDILFAKITPSTEHGKGALIKDFHEEIGFASTELVVLSPKREVIDAEYLFYYSKFGPFRNRAVKLMEGATGRQRVPSFFFKTQLVAVPSCEEQKQIASILLNIDNQLQNNRIYHNYSKSMKKGLMQVLLTGQKRVSLP